MSELLRVYLDPAEVGLDGYPLAWHGVRIRTDSGIERMDAIKDLIRERDGHRCLRCGHPYPPGIAANHPRGEWTPCDEHCSHHDNNPVRVVGPGGELRAHYQLYNGGLEVARAEWEADDAPLGSVIEAQWRILTCHHLNGLKYDCRWFNLVSLCQVCHLSVQGRVRMEQVYPYQHTEWFRPFAAAYYAWTYLGEELTQEETLARLDELLSLERVA